MLLDSRAGLQLHKQKKKDRQIDYIGIQMLPGLINQWINHSTYRQIDEANQVDWQKLPAYLIRKGSVVQNILLRYYIFILNVPCQVFPSGLRSGSWILSALLEHLSTAPSTLSVSGKLLSPFEPVQSPTCADRRKCPRKSLQLPLAVPIKNHIAYHHIQSTILLNFCYKGGAHTCFIECITYSCGYEAHMSSTRDWSSVIQCF